MKDLLGERIPLFNFHQMSVKDTIWSIWRNQKNFLQRKHARLKMKRAEYEIKLVEHELKIGS